MVQFTLPYLQQHLKVQKHLINHKINSCEVKPGKIRHRTLNRNLFGKQEGGEYRPYRS
jgi:hypothetical protein